MKEYPHDECVLLPISQCGRLPKSEDEKPHSGADEPAEQETSA
jgi:hypothetical protein